MYPPLCGAGWCGVSSKAPRGVPIPPWPKQDRRNSGVSAAPWGWTVWCLLKTHTGLSLRGPSRTGGNQVYPPLCEGEWCSVSSKPPRGVPIPPRPRQDRRDSSVSAAVWGWMVRVSPKTPMGRPYPTNGPGRTGGTRVYPPLCGGERARCIHGSPSGCPHCQGARTRPAGYKRLHLWEKATLHPRDRPHSRALAFCKGAVPSVSGPWLPPHWRPPSRPSTSRYPLPCSPGLVHPAQRPC